MELDCSFLVFSNIVHWNESMPASFILCSIPVDVLNKINILNQIINLIMTINEQILALCSAKSYNSTLHSKFHFVQSITRNKFLFYSFHYLHTKSIYLKFIWTVILKNIRNNSYPCHAFNDKDFTLPEWKILQNDGKELG